MALAKTNLLMDLHFCDVERRGRGLVQETSPSPWEVKVQGYAHGSLGATQLGSPNLLSDSSGLLT